MSNSEPKNSHQPPQAPISANQLDKLKDEIKRLTRPHDMPRRIELCRQALTLVERESSPRQWASWHYELADSLRQTPLGLRTDNLEQAIHHYQQALEVYTRQATPSDWAQTEHYLALALSLRIEGERSDNLEQAISLYKEALEVRTREDLPEKWSATQNNLGLAYSNRIKGERGDNLERAIWYYEQALEVTTRQAYPEYWADTQNNLGLAYSNRIKGERSNNLEEAISLYQQALEVYTQQAYPEDWARTQNNLAIAYHNRIKGKPDNLEQAIHHYKQALEVYTQQAYSEKWAETQHNLAIAYFHRIKGERGDNLERVIWHYEQALEVYTQQAYPEKRADIQNDLAYAYHNRIKGERGDNLEQAIFHAEQALEVRTRQVYPEDWARIQSRLASAYRSRIKGQRGDNLEQTIFHTEQALEVYTRQAHPQDWADTQYNLASTYNLRIKGQRGDNLEQAIFYAEQALEVRTRQAYPEKWADTQNNLAVAYLYRIKGERRDNLEQSIHHYQQALEIHTRQAYPERWALTQNNLGEVYRLRIKGQRDDNLEQVIDHYQQALEVFTRQTFPEQWADTQNYLAKALTDRIKGERGDNLEQAIFHAKQALEIRTRQAYPGKWADTQNNLANAYSYRIKGERGENLEQAIAHYQQTLEVFTPHSFPQDCRNTAYRLGRLLYDEQRLSEARLAFVTGHEAVEALRGEAVRGEAKRELAEKNADLYARLVACCLHDGDEAAAFEIAVAGKGRLFVDLLGSAQFDFATVAAQKPELAADWRQAGELRQQIDQLLVRLNKETGEKEEQRAQQRGLYGQLREEQEKLSKHWQEMNWKYPILSATESAPTLSAAQACELASQLNGTLVEYVRHAEGLGAFVVSAGLRHLDKLGTSQADIEPVEMQEPQLRYVPLSLVDDTLLGKIERWVEQLKEPWGRGKLSYKRLSVWHEALIAPLGLPKSGALVLAPFGRLHLLPLAALRATKNAPYLAAEYNLSFVPTLGALRALRDQERKDASMASDLQVPKLLSVAYPGTPLLPNVLLEGKAITGYFAEATTLHDAVATPDAVLKAAPGKQIVHFGCHGWFDSEHPRQSGLMLANGWLTVQRIISELNLKESRLATLAACESGKSDVRSGEEYVGLMQAIMTAGAKSVVASLWGVNDNATRALFEAFYANLTQGEAPVFALQHAQEALRQRAHWRHPYYWAAFTVSGLAHSLSLRPTDPASRQARYPLAEGSVPEPVEGPPINLSEHLDQLNRSSQQGEHLMNEEQMKATASVILDQIIEYASEIQDELNPSEAAILLEALNAISEQSHQAQSEADQLAIAHAIQTLAEELPSLRDLLLEEHTDIAELQTERAITLQHHQKTIKGEKEAQAAIPGITNDLIEARETLAKYLPDSPPSTDHNESWRDRLWKKMGLK